jgi:hypothetical protein
LGVALLLVAAVFVLFHQHQLVYPTPETETAFLRQYNPEGTAKPYFSQYIWWMSGGQSSGAGEQSATHGKDFDYHFVIETSNRMPLMTTLAADMTKELRQAGAEVTSVSGDERQGFRFEYVSGNTIGSATINPLEIPDQQQKPSRCMRGDEATARLKVTIREEWFKEKPRLISVRVSDIR